MRRGSKPRTASALLLGLGIVMTARADELIEFSRLGAVTLYQPTGRAAEGLVLFLSGDDGWSPVVAGMAGHLTERGFLVAGIDSNQFRQNLLGSGESCTFTAGDLETFAHFLESKLRFARYINPVLAGYGSGATLAYISLVQAPAGTFKGAISLGFCPNLAWPSPMCHGVGAGLQSAGDAHAGFVPRPAPRLADPWIAMARADNAVCSIDVNRGFVAAIPGAELVVLPGGRDGVHLEQDHLPQFLAAVERIAAIRPAANSPAPTSIKDLPLVEIAATGPPRDHFAIMLSGDGGWAGLDREVAAVLAANGVPVVGWDSLRYFWKSRTPEGAARDLGRVIDHYTRA